MERIVRFDGQVLQRLRKARNWSLEELSQRSGLSISHISQLEKGTRKSPSIDLVFHLAEAFSVSMYQFLTRSPELKPQGDLTGPDAFTYPTVGTPSNQQTPAQIADGWSEWGRTMHPDLLQFIMSEDGEAYLLFAKRLYDHRKSHRDIFQLMTEFMKEIDDLQAGEDGP